MQPHVLSIIRDRDLIRVFMNNHSPHSASSSSSSGSTRTSTSSSKPSRKTSTSFPIPTLSSRSIRSISLNWFAILKTSRRIRSCPACTLCVFGVATGLPAAARRSQRCRWTSRRFNASSRDGKMTWFRASSSPSADSGAGDGNVGGVSERRLSTDCLLRSLEGRAGAGCTISAGCFCGGMFWS
jgi:hypothetical protein